MQAIGQKIKQIIKEEGRTYSWVCKNLPTSRTNLYDVFTRTSIDTDLLKRFSKLLNHDFFQYVTKPQSTMAAEPKTEYKADSPVLKIVLTDEEIVHDAETQKFLDMLQAFAEEYFKAKKPK